MFVETTDLVQVLVLSFSFSLCAVVVVWLVGLSRIVGASKVYSGANKFSPFHKEHGKNLNNSIR